MLPKPWQGVVGDEVEKPYFQELQQFVTEERLNSEVYPPAPLVFNALRLTPFKKVKVVILGQDPYHDAGQAHGLCFSVPPGIKPPPSLVNIFKELLADVGCTYPGHGCLIPWAKQGVLLLNAVLTVRAHQPQSHRARGWERFTDAIIQRLSERAEPVVFVLWGKPAQVKSPLIDLQRHVIITGAHPSPLSAKHGFFGSRPFSTINRQLRAWGQAEINWQLPAKVRM
jgi:uracil-DNA glycosylase